MTLAPQDILEKWLGEIRQGDIENLLSLYDKEAILIPTFSNLILDNPTKLRQYFEKLVQRNGLEISVHQKTIHEQRIGPETVVLSGIYTWKFIVEEELITYEARFSFLLRLNNPSPIIHHHSSQIPRMI